MPSGWGGFVLCTLLSPPHFSSLARGSSLVLGTGDLEWLRLLGAEVRAGRSRGAPGRGSGGSRPFAHRSRSPWRQDKGLSRPTTGMSLPGTRAGHCIGGSDSATRGVGLLLPRSFISSSGWGPLSEPSRSGVKGVTEGTGEGPLGFQEVSLWGHTESDTAEAT